MAFGRSSKKEKEASTMDLLVEYSQNLGESASKIQEAASSFDSSAGAIQSNIEKLSAVLAEFSNNFRETIDKEERERREKGEKFKDDQQSYIKAYGEGGEKLFNKFQKIGEIFVKSFSKILSYNIDKLTNGFNDIIDAYNSNLTSVTSRMDKSNHEYTEMLNEATSNIRKDKLTSQFSEIDFLGQLQKILDTGIRGQTAEEMAYRNMITEKLLPMINTNTKAYIQSTKMMKSTFSDTVESFGSYVQKVYGAESLEEGGYDAFIQSFGDYIAFAAKGDTDKYNKAFGQMETFMGMTSKMLGSEGKDMISDYLLGILKGEPGSSVLGSMLGLVTPDDVINLINGSPEDWDNFYKNLQEYATNIINQAGEYGLSFNNIVADELGYDKDLVLKIYNALTYGTGEGVMSVEEAMRQYELEGGTSGIVEGLHGNLSNNKYQSATDRQKKSNENTAANIANRVAEYIPDPTGVLNLINGTVSDIFGLLKMMFVVKAGESVLGGLKGGDGGLLGKLFGKGVGKVGGEVAEDVAGEVIEDVVGSSSGGNLLKTLGGKILGAGGYAGPMTFAEAVGPGTGKVGLSNLLHPEKFFTSTLESGSITGSFINFAAGALAPIIGASMGAWDVMDSVDKVRDEEDATKGTEWSEGIRAFFTGHDYVSDQEKIDATDAALQGEKIREFDWKKVGFNATKWGLIGTGVGTAVGGWAAGAGTAIGAGVGAAAGAITSIIDQTIDNARYSQLADAANKTAEAFDNLSQSQEDYTETIKSGEDKLKLVNSILDARKSNDEKSLKLAKENFKLLQDAYPEILGNITDLNDITSDDIEKLKEKIRLENESKEKEMVDSAKEAFESAEKELDEFDDIVKNKDIKSNAALDFVNKLIESGGEDSSWDSATVLEKLNEVIKSNYGLNPGDEGYQEKFNALVAELNSGKSGEILDVDKDGNVLGITGTTGHGATLGDNAFQFKEDYGDANEKLRQAQGLIKDYRDKAKQLLSTILTLYINNVDTKTGEFKEGVSIDSQDNYRDAVTTFDEWIKMINEAAESYGGNDHNLDYLKVNSKDGFNGVTSKDINDIYRVAGVEIGFKSGLDYVPYDNFIANLHKGEMVLNSYNSNLLRSVLDNNYNNPLVSSKAQKEVSDYLTFLTEIGTPLPEHTQSRNINEESVNDYEPVVLAIGIQTDTLSEILERIYSEITSYFVKATTGNTGVILSDKLVSYRGL